MSLKCCDTGLESTPATTGGWPPSAPAAILAIPSAAAAAAAAAAAVIPSALKQKSQSKSNAGWFHGVSWRPRCSLLA